MATKKTTTPAARPAATPAKKAAPKPAAKPGQAGFVGPVAKPAPAPAPAPKKTTTTKKTTTKAAPKAAAATPPANTPQQIDDYIRQNYGYMSWALDVPDLKTALESAATSGFDADRLQAAIQGTNWWKTHSAAQRSWQELQSSDPGEANSKIQQSLDSVNAYAKQFGIPVSDSRARQIASDALSLGWSDQELHNAIANEFVYNPNDPTLQNATVENLREQASQQVVPLSDTTIQDWVRQIASGSQSIDNFKAYAANQAKNMYNDPNLQSAIDSGQTVRQYVDPLVQKTADLLGVNANTINLNEDKWNRMLQSHDDKGVLQIPTIADWSRTVRTNSTYGYDGSQNGLTDSAQLTQGLGQMMGAIG